MLSRTMHGIAYDEVADRIIVPAQFSQAILSFRGDAKGEEPPVRVIQGPRTELRQADRVTVDPLRKEIFVGDAGQVLVFPSDANGDVAPIRAIRGPDTRLGDGGGPPAVAVDPVNKVLIVGSRAILIFDITANGNVKPLRVITGSGAGGRLTAYNGLIFGSGNRRINVWSIHDDGAVPPRWTFGEKELLQIRGLAVDAKNKSVIITDKELNAVLTYYLPEVFAQDGQAENRRN